MYADLVEIEQKLDWTITRKKVEVQDAVQRPTKVSRSSHIRTVHSRSGCEELRGVGWMGQGWMDAREVEGREGWEVSSRGGRPPSVHELGRTDLPPLSGLRGSQIGVHVGMPLESALFSLGGVLAQRTELDVLPHDLSLPPRVPLGPS